MRLATLAVLTMTSVMAVGCSNTRTLSLLSTRNVDISGQHEIVERGASDSETRFWLLFIPFAGEPDGIGATRSLLEKKEGDYLTNVEVKSTGWSLLAISWGSVTIKGDVYRRISPTAASAVAEPSAAAPVAGDDVEKQP
jgi:hypothetical protein